MKKISTLICMLALFCCSAISQEINSENAKKLSKQTIKVILNRDDETSYSDALKKSVEKYWTFSKYEFVFKEDLVKMYKGSYEKNTPLLGYFIIDVHNMYVNWFNYPVFGISNCYKCPNKLNHHYLGNCDFHYYIPFAQLGYPDEEIQAYLDMYIGILNEAFTYVIDSANKIENNKFFLPEYIENGKPKIFNKKVLFYGKDLYLSEDEMKIYYDHPYEIVSKEDYIKAIIERKDVWIYWFYLAAFGHYQYLVNPSNWHVKLYVSNGELKNDKQKKKAQIKYLGKISK